jgi:hypothetical protein
VGRLDAAGLGEEGLLDELRRIWHDNVGPAATLVTGLVLIPVGGWLLGASATAIMGAAVTFAVGALIGWLLDAVRQLRRTGQCNWWRALGWPAFGSGLASLTVGSLFAAARASGFEIAGLSVADLLGTSWTGEAIAGTLTGSALAGVVWPSLTGQQTEYLLTELLENAGLVGLFISVVQGLYDWLARGGGGQ